MKKSTLLILLVISILLSGCQKVTRNATYVGPDAVTYEKQVASYTKKHGGKINIFRVNADIYDTSDRRIESDTLVYYPDGDYYAGEWAPVQSVEGEESDTLRVYFEKNETEYLRWILVSMQHPLDGEIRVKQLPAGVDELPEL